MNGTWRPGDRLRATAYVGRGCKYALTTLLAAVAGHLLSATGRAPAAWLSILVLTSAATYFFLVYVIGFHYEGPAAWPGRAALPQSDALILHRVILVLLMLIAVLGYVAAHRQNPPGPLAAALTFYVLMQISYAHYLLRIFRTDARRLARHQLFWPVIASIALPLYAGLTLPDAERGLGPVLPAIALAMFFVLSEYVKLSQRRLAAGSIATLIAAAGVVAWHTIIRGPYDGFVRHLSSLLFALLTAAYLAVFESWRVTAHLARSEQPPSSASALRWELLSTSERYYLATLGALSIATVGVPALYAFTRFGTLFLVLFAAHAVAAVWWWTRGDDVRQHLRNRDWTAAKNAFGFFFLAAMVFDAYVRIQPTSRMEHEFVSWDGFGTLAILVGLPSVQLARSLQTQRQDSESVWRSLVRLGQDRMNYIRAIALGSLTLCALLLAWTDRSIQRDSLVVFKAHQAFLVYSAFVVLAFVAEILWYVKSRPAAQRSITSLLALAQVTRVGTSTGVGLAVALPLWNQDAPPSAILSGALPFALIAMGGFAFNDWFDEAADRVSKPYRVLPRRTLESRTVGLVGLVFVTLGGLLAVWFKNPTELVEIQLLAAAAVLAYNYVVRYAGVIKAFYSAAVCCLPLLYAHAYGDVRGPAIGWVLFATGCFVAGRELLMDTLDVAGDRLASIRTVPIVFGEWRAERLAWSLQLTAVGVVLPITLWTGNAWASIVVAGCGTIVLALLARWYALADLRNRRLVVRGLWLAMLPALTAMFA